MHDNNKHIKTLIAGLLANNDARVDQITDQLVESMLPAKQQLIVESLNGIFQRNNGK